jgi:hypothetical protein
MGVGGWSEIDNTAKLSPAEAGAWAELGNSHQLLTLGLGPLNQSKFKIIEISTSFPHQIVLVRAECLCQQAEGTRKWAHIEFRPGLNLKNRPILKIEMVC